MRDLGITLDGSRAERLGFDEAIFAEGKSAAQLDAKPEFALEGVLERVDVEGFGTIDGQGLAFHIEREPALQIGGLDKSLIERQFDSVREAHGRMRTLELQNRTIRETGLTAEGAPGSATEGAPD